MSALPLMILCNPHNPNPGVAGRPTSWSNCREVYDVTHLDEIWADSLPPGEPLPRYWAFRGALA